MLHAAGKCDCCRRVEALSEWLHKNLDEVPAIGPDSVAAAEAVIRKLKGRVAELEAELADVLEDQALCLPRKGDIYFSHFGGESTWSVRVLRRLQDLQRLAVLGTDDQGRLYGRFLPRKESNELPPTDAT